MKVFNLAPFALVLAALTACGTAYENGNMAELVEPNTLEGEAAVAELQALGFNGDACKISLSQATYTLAQGGSISINYSFFKLSAGDRVRITRISDGKKVWGSRELSAASGVLTVPVSELDKGEFRIQGFLNTYKTNQEADCGPNVRVVIRVK
ncbi:MAG: hypothetical protein FJY29_04020 [Betaproteobacteria bacterium]|nr:hypothetical protein [Betaproteobacteria bacterium]